VFILGTPVYMAVNRKIPAAVVCLYTEAIAWPCGHSLKRLSINAYVFLTPQLAERNVASD
jgi:hypothetical protein